jgi:23S rRNA (guanosine2251-2'-O)-methyltransferase
MEQLEGRQSVLAALVARRRKFEVILIDHSAHEEKIREVLDAAREVGVAVKRVSSREINAMAHGATHGGVLAVCSAKPRTSEDELLEILSRLKRPAMLLLIEGIEDARNLGFTLRSAEALGADAVLIKKHLWDLDPLEIARPASGAFERLPLVHVEDMRLIARLRRGGMRLLGCIAGARKSLFDSDLTQGVILAIGGEKRGLSAAAREICDELVTIPIVGGASSLPLSHAAAIVLAEAARQRGLPT